MATLTATAAAAGAPVRLSHEGVFAIPVRYNSGSTAFSASATTVLLAKIPNKVWITGIRADYSLGTTTCPADLGISNESLSYFVSGATIGAMTIANGRLPYYVSITDTATPYVYLTITPTAGSTCTSFIANVVVECQSA